MIERSRSFSRVVPLLAAMGCALLALLPNHASASVSLAVTWDGLLRESFAAAVVTSAESLPIWENGRIYTYTRVHVDRPLAGSLAVGSDAWIRTMGGIVGKVGQLVEGEAGFAPGETSLLFLRPGPLGAYVVTARGQGQFPVVVDAASARPHLVESQAVGMLLSRPVAQTTSAPRLAADVLHGRLLDDVAGDIAAGWGAAHAAR